MIFNPIPSGQPRSFKGSLPSLVRSRFVPRLVFFILLLLGLLPAWANSESELSLGKYAAFKPEGHISRFNGEHLFFDVSFMIFDNAATADVYFYKRDGIYYSVLKAETKGFVGFFTSYRKHFYKASFDLIDNGRRVRTRKFEREVIIGDEVERTTHFLDYENRKHFWYQDNNGKITEKKTEPIPDGKFMDDILAAFYNFRNSVYGPLEKGADFKIDTIPDKTMKDISVHILNREEEDKFRENEDRPPGNELLLKVVIPKEVFKTKTGELIFWSSDNYVPLETKVLDYVLLGDLHVKFRERRVHSPGQLSTTTVGSD